MSIYTTLWKYIIRVAYCYVWLISGCYFFTSLDGTENIYPIQIINFISLFGATITDVVNIPSRGPPQYVAGV